MKLKAFFLVFAISCILFYASATQIKKFKKNLPSHLAPIKPTLHKVALHKVKHSPEKKTKLLDLLSQAHKNIRAKKNAGQAVFLQKSQETCVETHELKLGNYRNAQYLGDLAIANSTNTFKVVYDTGSANIWINSDKCKDSGCTSHKQFKPQESTTYKPLGYGLDVEFGTGELLGEINADNVFIAGVQIDTQNFAEITHEIGDIFEDSGFDGIVGLSYPTMAAYQMEPIFDNVMKQGKLDHNVFSFYLDELEDAKNSRLILGGADPTYYKGPLMFFPVTEQYYWSVKASQILVGGKDIGICQGGCTVVADTGTSLITGPATELDTLFEALNIDEMCNNYYEMPEITFVLADGVSDPSDTNAAKQEGRFTMKPEDYLFISSDFMGLTSTCTPAIMPLDVPEPHGPLWILGDAFLKKFYSVYDRDHNVVGFAEAIPGITDDV